MNKDHNIGHKLHRSSWNSVVHISLIFSLFSLHTKVCLFVPLPPKEKNCQNHIIRCLILGFT